MTSLDTFNQLAKWIGYVQTVWNKIMFSYARLCYVINNIQHATADVSLMLVASKSDLEGKREVTREDGMKVGIMIQQYSRVLPRTTDQSGPYTTFMWLSVHCFNHIKGGETGSARVKFGWCCAL